MACLAQFSSSATRSIIFVHIKNDPEARWLSDNNGQNIYHYACANNDMEFISLLADIGINLLVKDKLGKSPAHYAAFNSHILANADEKVMQAKDSAGVMAFEYSLQHAKDKDTWMKFFSFSPDDYQLGITHGLLQDTIEFIPLQNNVQRFALKRYCDLRNVKLNDDFYSQAKQHINKNLLKSISRLGLDFSPGLAFGVEIELDLRPFTYIPIDDFVKLHAASLVEDYSVTRSLFSLRSDHDYKKIRSEIVSDIISDNNKLLQILSMCHYLYRALSTGNKSAGLHVHVNCRGSFQSMPILEPYIKPDKELLYIKYLLINYITIESLLLAFLRNGAGFDNVGNLYSVPVSSITNIIETIHAATSIEELQKICDHATTVDLTALEKHGTVEFRLHETVIHYKIVYAWISMLAQLANISKNQALNHSATDTLSAYKNIEELVYLLIATRDYKNTWDVQRAAPIGYSYLPKPITLPEEQAPQEQIISSSYYKLLTSAVYNEDNKFDSNLTQLAEGQETNTMLSSFLNSLRLRKESKLFDAIQLEDQILKVEDKLTSGFKSHTI